MSASESFRSRLLGASLLLGGAMVLRLLLVLVRNKMLAVWLGPAGLGVLSQMGGIADILTFVCTCGMGMAVARYTAGRSEELPHDMAPGALKAAEAAPTAAEAARVALRFMMVSAIATTFVTWQFSTQLAQWFIGDPVYGPLMGIVALTLPSMVYYQYALGLLQGAARVRSQVVQSVVYSVLWLGLAVLFVWRSGLTGGAWSIVAVWLCVALVSWWLLHRSQLSSLAFRQGSLWKTEGQDAETFRVLARYGSIALAGALSQPLTMVGMRAVLIHYGGEEAAGFYQVPVAASNLTFSMLVTALAGFVLPHVYRNVHHSEKLNPELETTLRIILAFMTPAVVLVLLLKGPFTHLLFSSEFQRGAPMMAPQLCADWLHAIVWWLALTLLPAGLYAVSFLCEIAALALTIGLAWLLMPHFGLAGATMATALAQGTVLVSLWTYRARRDHLRLRPSTWFALAGCGALVFTTAWLMR